MKISEALDIIKIQKVFQRTSCGRSITEEAVESLDATLQDEKNYETDAIHCLGCCIILSGLLASEGCPNCNCKDLKTDTKITKETKE